MYNIFYNIFYVFITENKKYCLRIEGNKYENTNTKC